MHLISSIILVIISSLIIYSQSQQQYGAPQPQQQYGQPQPQQQYLPQQQRQPPQQQYGPQQPQQQYLPQQSPQPQQQYGQQQPQQPQQQYLPQQSQQSQQSYGPQQPQQQYLPQQTQQPQQQYGTQQQQRRQIGADNESTMLIVAALCKPGALNEDVVNRFFACYSQVKGTDVYLNCQHEAYGCILNTERTITSTCSGMGKFKVYMECLVRNFKKANIDLIPSATKLNQCMAEVLNVGF